MKAASVEKALDEIAAVREIIKDSGTQNDFPVLRLIGETPEEDQRDVLTDAVAAVLWLGLKLGGVK